MRRIKIPLGVKLFAAIWIAALCVPTVRELPHTFAFYELIGESGGFNDGVASNLARRYPDNPVAATWGAEDRSPYSEDYVSLFNADLVSQASNSAAIEKVAQRFSDDLQIRALQIRNFAQTIPDLNKARQKSDAKQRAQWIEAAQLARGSGQLEPGNAFWPWMETSFLFAASRDEDALTAFEHVGRCTRYNDYSLATLRSRIHLWESVGTPTWEQKVALWASTLFPHLAPMRDATDLVAGKARALREAGKDERALNLQSDILLASRLCRRNADALITALVAEDAARRSLEKFLNIPRPVAQVANSYSPTYDAPPTIYVDPTIHGAQLSDAWANYARANGQPRRAELADFVAEPSLGQLNHIEDVTLEIFGLGAPWGNLAIIAPMILLTLAITIGAGATLWAVGRPLKFEGVNPTRGQIVACSNFSFWLLLGIIAVVIGLRRDLFLSEIFTGLGNHTTNLVVVGSLFLSGLCWLLPIWFVGLTTARRWTRSRPSNARPLAPKWNLARKVLWIIFAVSLLLTLSNGRGLWDETWFQISNSAFAANLTLIAALSLEFARWWLGGWRFRWGPRAEKTPVSSLTPTGLKRWAPHGLWLICGLFLVSPINNTVVGVPFSESIYSLFLSTLIGAGALFVSWRTSRDHLFWRLAHRSMGVLIIAWSFIFLLTALASWPVRTEINRNLERRITIGEIAWMREQIAKQK